MFHHPAVEWTHLQAEALGIPQVTSKASGVKEEELAALRNSLEALITSHQIECVVTGAIASEYQRSRIDRICDQLGLRVEAPLWKIEPELLLREQIAMGFKFLLTATMAMGLSSDWLGRTIDDKALDELKRLRAKYGINLAFEGGEAESFVTDAPIFSKMIRILASEPVWNGDSGYLRIVRADLAEKRA